MHSSIELNKQGEFFVEDYARIILTKILTPFSTGYVDLQSPSGAINNVIVLTMTAKYMPLMKVECWKNRKTALFVWEV